MKLFRTLREKELFSEYCDFLDWIFCENKFDKFIWDNKNKVQAFTKAVHKLDGITKESIHYGAKRSMKFPGFGEYKRFSKPTIYMSRGESEARDLLRHIRNGIAHGNTRVYGSNNLVIEILDYGKTTDQQGGQTAYMCFPLVFLLSVYKVYHQKEKTWKRGR